MPSSAVEEEKSNPKDKQQNKNKYIEEQYAKYVREMGQFLDSPSKNNEDDNNDSPPPNTEEAIRNMKDEEDRDDDVDDEDTNSTPKHQMNKLKNIEEEIKVNLKQIVEDSGPINLAQLKISMPQMPDDLKETTAYFEQLMKEQLGESRYKKACQIIEQFKGGDIYYEKNENLLLRILKLEIFNHNEFDA
jgi:hypothetical protein